MRIDVPARRAGGIRLTPLIDVVFILLVFFMLASSFLDWRGIDVRFAASTEAVEADVLPIVVEVEPGGGLKVAGDSVEAGALVDELRALRERSGGEAARPVVIRPDADVPVSATIAVLDRLGAAGVGGVSLAEAGP